MKILIVLRAPTGGLWRHAVDLAEALALGGREVGLAIDANFSDAQTVSGLERLTPLMTLGVHRLPIRRQPGIGDIGAAWAIRKLAEELGVDIVHGHGAKGGLYARLAALGVRNRVSVYTPHGGALNYKVGEFEGDLYRKVETLMLSIIDAIAFESEFARRAYFDTIGAPRYVWRVIHNGLGERDFAPLEPAAEQFDFGFVGELRSAKGVPVMMKALAGVTCPGGKPATLIVAGGGPEEKAIHDLVSKLGITDRVRFVGVRPAREIFAASNCVLMPSLAESLPYVILEAAATGKQVIATNVGGIKEIFGPYADRLIPANDVPALQEAMKSYLADPADGARQGLELRDFVAEHFHVQRMTADIEKLYAETLDRRGG